MKGFLSTLDQDSKDTYSLINTIDSKALQTKTLLNALFKKSQKLLDADGVCAIILPSSILKWDKSNQELETLWLLKHFSIVAITFGSGTLAKQELVRLHYF